MDLKDIIKVFAKEIVIALIGLVFSGALFAVSDQSQVQFAVLVFGGLLLAWILIIFLLKLHRQKIENASMSSSAVVKNSEQQGKKLLKISKKIRKKLKHCVPCMELDKTEHEYRQVIKQITRKKKPSSNKELLLQRAFELSETISDSKIKKIIESLQEKQHYKVAESLVDTFINLERVLLNAEQFDLRIEFGKFILDFSYDDLKIQRALLDFLGWTNMMKGKTSDGERYIKEGIKRAELSFKTSGGITSKYNIVRGYRHLGSSRDIYENDPQKALDYLKSAENEFAELLNISEVANVLKEKLDEMEVGIAYGILTAQFSLFKSPQNKNKILFSNDDFIAAFYRFDKLIDKAKGFTNKHRFTKLCLMKCKYINLMLRFNLVSKEQAIVSHDCIENLLKNVKPIFDSNIFIDEAVEYYLEESVKLLKCRILSLFAEEAV